MMNMRKLITCIFWALVTALPTTLHAQTAVLRLDGVYQGKDLYVKNPFGENGVGFCVTQVEVNGKITADEINSSAFAIDMSALGLQVGEEVHVAITHKDACQPSILNPEAIKPRSTYDIVNMSVTQDGLLTWTTKNESGQLPFEIMDFRWNKWVKVGEVMGVGSRGIHDYKFKLTPHSGVNRVRVQQVDYTGDPHVSESREFVNPYIKPVSFKPERAENTIYFSEPTMYEIFDEFGNLMKKGFGKEIDITNLKSGKYYLNYDNSFGDTFVKKKH